MRSSSEEFFKNKGFGRRVLKEVLAMKTVSDVSREDRLNVQFERVSIHLLQDDVGFFNECGGAIVREGSIKGRSDREFIGSIKEAFEKGMLAFEIELKRKAIDVRISMMSPEGEEVFFGAEDMDEFELIESARNYVVGLVHFSACFNRNAQLFGISEMKGEHDVSKGVRAGKRDDEEIDAGKLFEGKGFILPTL